MPPQSEGQLADSEIGSKSGESSGGDRFSECVCKLVFGREKFNNQVFGGNLIANKMVVNENMFGAGVKQVTVHEVRCSDVITT